MACRSPEKIRRHRSPIFIRNQCQSGSDQSAIRNRVIRFIYNLLWPIGLLFFLPGYLMKMVRRGGYREKFGQRLGIYDRELRARLSQSSGKRPTWLHAVSVGEVMVALKLAQQLQRSNFFPCVCPRRTQPDLLGDNNAPHGSNHVDPLIFGQSWSRIFYIHPVKIVLEAEIWPILLPKRCSLSTVLGNARSRSVRRRFAVSIFVAPTFRSWFDLRAGRDDVDR